MKQFTERNAVLVGAIGVATVVGLVVTIFQYDKLPFISDTASYSAYFAESGGISSGSKVRISGVGVGEVSDVRLDGPRVLVDFTVRRSVHLGDRTEAAIKVETVLGARMLEVSPRGSGELSGVIPLERTHSPYDVSTALGDLTTTISGLDTTQISDALTTLADTFRETPPDLKLALDGVARFSDVLNSRDAQLRNLLSNADNVSAVLARRTDQVVTLVRDSNALLAALLARRDAIDALLGNLRSVSTEISGLVADNRAQLRPALDKLNGVLGILDTNKKEVEAVLPGLSRYLTSFGEAVASGPFFKGYVANLFPGQFSQPIVDAALFDRPLDPNTPLPSGVVAPQTGTPPIPPPPVVAPPAVAPPSAAPSQTHGAG